MENKLARVSLGGKEVGDGCPVHIILEGGVTNYGEIELAKRQIDAGYDAGVDSVKFQVTITENLVSRAVAERLAPVMGHDWFQRMKYKEFTFDEVRELARYAATGGMPFFATAHDIEALDFLDKELNIPFFKVGSGEAHNYEFLENIGRRGKPVIMSFGLQTDEEIVKAVATLRNAGTKDIVALHCTTIYPTPYEKVDLTRMLHLKELLGVPVGISDHSVGDHVVLAGVALGACMVEKHITFGKSDPRSLDNPGALYPHEWKDMVRKIRDIEKALLPMSREERQKALEAGRNWAGQSIVAKEMLPPGTVLSKDHVAFKRPGQGGMAPDRLLEVVGKTVQREIPKDEQILPEYFH